MAVYVDQSRNVYRRMIMCHMIADTLDELHSMAQMLGLHRRWFQEHASTPHYDISLGKRYLALRLGAVSVDRRKFVEVIRRLRDEKRRSGEASGV